MMDTTTLPPWAQTALAIAAVVIAALTMLANFLDWAVPKLRALGPKGEEARALSALEKFALALTTVLAFVHRLVPRLTVIDPAAFTTAATTVAPAAPAPTIGTAPDPNVPASPPVTVAPAATTNVPPDTNPPHGPFAG